jgi:hypothetical protein
MGTQQILMIILSVIVVGAAIAVGIQMFDTQSDNQALQACVVELMQQGAQAQAWFRTPVMMGGGGNGREKGASGAWTTVDLTEPRLAQLIRFVDRNANTTTMTITNIHGDFEYAIDDAEANIITITAESAVKADITPQATVDLTGTSGSIEINPYHEG